MARKRSSLLPLAVLLSELFLLFFGVDSAPSSTGGDIATPINGQELMAPATFSFSSFPSPSAVAGSYQPPTRRLLRGLKASRWSKNRCYPPGLVPLKNRFYYLTAQKPIQTDKQKDGGDSSDVKFILWVYEVRKDGVRQYRQVGFARHNPVKRYKDHSLDPFYRGDIDVQDEAPCYLHQGPGTTVKDVRNFKATTVRYQRSSRWWLAIYGDKYPSSVYQLKLSIAPENSPIYTEAIDHELKVNCNQFNPELDPAKLTPKNWDRQTHELTLVGCFAPLN